MTTFLFSTTNISSLCASGLIANMKMYKYIYTCYTYTHHTWVQADGQSHLRVAFSYCWKTISTHTDSAKNSFIISSSTPRNILTKHSLVLSFMLHGRCPSLSWGWIEQDGKQGWMGDETQWLDGSRWETPPQFVVIEEQGKEAVAVWHDWVKHTEPLALLKEKWRPHDPG